MSEQAYRFVSMNASGPACLLNGKELSYEQIRDSLDRSKHLLHSDEVVFLKGARSLDFIVEILRCLEFNIPVCVYPDSFSSIEIQNLEQKIDKEKLHTNCSLMLLTSGSSGESKIVQLSLKNIETSIKAISGCLKFEDISSQVLFLPFSYSFGLIGQLLPAIKLGKKTILIDHLIRLKDSMRQYTPEMISGVPSHHKAIIKVLDKNECLGITHVISAGAPLDIALRKEMLGFYPSTTEIFNNYGQTELSPRALILSSQDKHFLQGGVGRVVPGLEARLSEDNEIEFKGEQVMLGYVGQGEVFDNKTWLNTKDRARKIDDVFYIEGRTDNLIKIRGVRVSLDEIENELKEKLMINEAKILVSSDDDSEKYGVFFYQGKNTQESIREFISENKRFNIIRKIVKLDGFPLNTNGKINKAALRALIKS